VLGMRRVFRHLPRSRKLVLVLWVFVAVVIILLALSYETIQTLSAARAYVGGEGLWSKAQKEAVHSLVRYAASHSEQDYARYLQALQTPLGDKRARLELEKENPDPIVVYEGFVQGRNRPEDVDGLAKLFRTFRHTKYMAEAITIWVEADSRIEELQRLGDALHMEITSGRPDPLRVQGIARQVDFLGDQLTPLEDRFSYALGEGARWTAGLFLLVTSVATVLSLAMGAAVTFLMLRHARQTEERYKHLIDTANDGILVIDAETGRILEGNERSAELLGVPVSQLIGKLGEEFCPEDNGEEYWQMVRDTVSGANVASKEMQLRDAEGRVIAVEVNTSLTELQGKKIIQGIFRDIRERKRLEEEVRQAQKMEVVGRLAGGIAHDFNNLIMVILTQLSKIRAASSGQVLDHVETILSAAVRAGSLTKQLLAFGRKQVLLLEVVDLNDLLREMQPILSTLPGYQVRLLLSPSGEVLPVRVDSGKIEQVVMNLAVNACDAMPTGGTLEIKTSRVARTNLTDCKGGNGPFVLLEVADTGCGMDPDTLAHIFEPFFTTKPTGKGTGLGLSTVYGIVKQTGGLIEVQSTVGQGTIFKAYFPLVKQTVETRKVLHIQEWAAAGSGTVLLAEDQTLIREAVRECLEANGYKVLDAENGEEALNIAKRYSGTIDVLVTDVVMPRIRGLELAKRIGRFHPGVAVVFMSGYSEESLVESGLLAETKMTLIQKPFDPEVLVAKMRRLLDAGKSRAS
jgi:two-component system, cell cycle sensor histidine kinase and response regulator CckA